jgi:hypothetical protein
MTTPRRKREIAAVVFAPLSPLAGRGVGGEGKTLVAADLPKLIQDAQDNTDDHNPR